MSLRTFGLATVGCGLIATSMGSCYVIVVGEIYSWLLVGVFVGGLVAGGGPLALAIFRLWHGGSPRAWPTTEQAQGLAVVGILLALGSNGSCYVLFEAAPLALGAVLGAVFFAGVALTIGAVMLLFGAEDGADSRP